MLVEGLNVFGDSASTHPEATRLTVLRARDAALDETAAALIGLDPDAAWLRVDSVRRVRVTEPPICFTTLHIPKPYAAVVEEIGLSPGPVHALMERFGLRLGSVEVDFSACGVPDAQAGLLEVSPGAPALLISRRYLDEQGRVFTQSENCHPAPRFTYRATLKREV